MIVLESAEAFFKEFFSGFLYPSSLAAALTLSTVSFENDTWGLLLKIIETLDWESPVYSAISLVVTLFLFPILPPPVKWKNLRFILINKNY